MKRRKRRSRTRRRRGWPATVLRALWLALLAVAASSVLAVVALRWVDPPTSAFILQQHVTAWWHNERQLRPRHVWVDAEAISPHAGVAVVAAEDQKFPHHHGFDVAAIADARREHGQGGRLRGASTISQQVAKNLFLWPGRTWVRKGLEAYFTVLIETLWPKRRILEVYLNVAEFGPGLFGVGAASEVIFRKPPARLQPAEAALLAAVLPNPVRLRADRPSAYVLERRNWILRQMEQLGGPEYLRGIAGSTMQQK